MSQELTNAIENLYTTFKPYRLDADFDGCHHCVFEQESKKLSSIPLRSITYSDIERYSSKAITTWGNDRHFRYFLPRLLELTITHYDQFLDLAVVYGKLSYANWYSWDQRDIKAIDRFFKSFWMYHLTEVTPIECECSSDTILCALGNAYDSIQPFLDEWRSLQNPISRMHLTTFVLLNSETILLKRRLWNSFWDTKSKPHQEVITWLTEPATIQYLHSPKDDLATNIAIGQLEAIQSV